MARQMEEYAYFAWLADQVGVSKRELFREESYGYLLRYLFDRSFYAVVDRDNLRSFDGERLRDSYQNTTGRPSPPLRDCTVLEMLVALSKKIEREIMYDYVVGDRKAEWFWMMLRNLGLLGYDNRHWNEHAAETIVNRFLDREYEPDGTGGLFPRQNPDRDQREMEIWWQMQGYMLDKYWK